MKVCLINPPWLFRLPHVDRWSNLLGLLYLGTTARDHGHQVLIIDALREGPDRVRKVRYGQSPYYQIGLSYDEILARIPRDAGCIGIGAPFTNLYHIIAELSSLLKERRPGAKVVLGGGLPSVMPELCRRIPGLDAVFIGECERALLDFLAAPDQSDPINGARVLHGQPEMDLDRLPIPDRRLAPTSRYSQSGSRNRTLLPTASLITSRGCPYNCHFCSIRPTMGQHWRGRSPENVLEEVSGLVGDHGVQMIDFEDDNFLHDLDRACALLDRLAALRRGHHGLLACAFPNGVRIDKLRPEILRLMREAGVHRLVLPVEHGDAGIRRKMGKPLSDDQVLDAAVAASEAGIQADVFVMVGYPDESDQVFESGLKLLLRMASLPGLRVKYLFPQPYPGTPLRQECLAKGYSIDAPDETTLCGIGPVITTPLFDRAELLRRGRRLEQMTQGCWKSIPPVTRPVAKAVRQTPTTVPEADGYRLVLAGAELREQPAAQHDGSYLENCRIAGSALVGGRFRLSDFVRCDFSGADLEGLDASYSSFVQCRFVGARLRHACLRECELTAVDLSDLDLTGADLSGAWLEHANLAGANLSGVALAGARLVGADLSRALLQGTILSECLVAATRMDDSIWRATVARDAFFEEASLCRVDGAEVSAQRSHFVRCDFTGSHFHAFLGAAAFVECCLAEAVIEHEIEDEFEFEEVWDGSGRHFVRRDDD